MSRSRRSEMARKPDVNRGGGVEEAETARATDYRRRMMPYVVTIVAAAASGAVGTALLRPNRSHAVSKHAQRAIQNRRNFEGRRGPWGVIEYTRIAISMPIEYAPDAPDAEPTRWWFQGGSRE